MKIKVEWTQEWPTNPGYYLFYGGYARQQPQLKFAKVVKNGNGSYSILAGGEFIYRSEQTGQWARVEFELPTVM